MTRVEHDQIQELILQSKTLAELAIETAQREEAGPVKGNFLPATLQAVVRSCEDAESMAEGWLEIAHEETQ